MLRSRLAVVSAALALSLVAGCSTLRHPWFGKRCDGCPTGDAVCSGDVVPDGPELGECGPPALPPGAVVTPPPVTQAVPPLATPPRLVPQPQAAPTPYTPPR